MISSAGRFITHKLANHCKQISTLPSAASTQAYSWGNGSDGQLGHYPEKSGLTQSYTELSPRPILSLEGDIKDVSCGLSHSAAVLADGTLYTWGKNDYGQLGQNSEEKTMPIPTVVEALEGIKIESVSCGHYHTAAIDENGGVWTWGYGGSFIFGQGGLGHGDKESLNEPTLVDVLKEDNVNIKAIACGEYHTLALSNDGEVWSWGKGEYGRLGLGSSSSSSLPELVELLSEFDSDKISAIACGQASSFAVTTSGKCYAWGRNDQGQLGIGGNQSMDVYAMEKYPIAVEGLDGQKVAQISAGSGHTLAVTEDGKLFQWGMRSGMMSPEEVIVLSRENVKVKYCAAGSNFSACVSKDGGVYTWAKGFMQRDILGHGIKEGKKHPTLIDSLFESNTCTKVSCGSKHSIAY